MSFEAMPLSSCATVMDLYGTSIVGPALDRIENLIRHYRSRTDSVLETNLERCQLDSAAKDRSAFIAQLLCTVLLSDAPCSVR